MSKFISADGKTFYSGGTPPSDAKEVTDAEFEAAAEAARQAAWAVRAAEAKASSIRRPPDA